MIFGFKRAESSDESTGRKLVVGLGNPGRKYEGTRHNIGFDVVAQVAKDWHASTVRNKFKGEVTDVRIREQQVCLLCPETYMNESGKSVKAAVDFYKIPNDDVLVICDDMALDLSRLRYRPKGSSGGQKGLGDIIRCLGSDQISRLRFGVGRPPDSWDVADYVLSKFTDKEITEREMTIRHAADSVADWVEHGTSYCMNKYNGK